PFAGLRRDRRLTASAANAVVASFAATLVAAAALLIALARHAFSIAIVADTTSRSLPTGYVLSAFWASQPGSLLLWLTVLGGAAAVVMLNNRHRNRELMPWVTAVLGGIMLFFSAMAAFVSPPFASTAGGTPANGFGLDPSLQTPYMVAHPPALYLGYVSLAVPFAFAMAALITGRTDARWLPPPPPPPRGSLAWVCARRALA